jgi:hypothetical protein
MVFILMVEGYSIGTNLDTNWFLRDVTKKLGNGLHTCFWSDVWVGETPLKDRFPRLFSISTQKEVSVAGVRKNINGTSSWDLNWRRRFFVWEHDLYNELLDLINPVTLVEDSDSWGWVPEGEGFYGEIRFCDCLLLGCTGGFGCTMAWLHFLLNLEMSSSV